ncbi:MFS transporter [Rubrivivax gelatinosus]|uniref:Putative MFS family arabinose efflux permease n=1 Tax=Rubrivivax gelatinosus TaxID=28068 RepID=A0A4R2MKM5_RUBGE|nr:MFS transporter [Rubrivivax gelatinosus]MBK1686642.1 MFS transporter [Rubrivivax gelatinosus]TCP05334.1 putative MFS family arabinose efflux permease [Rubrivivax gelatinosus]
MNPTITLHQPSTPLRLLLTLCALAVVSQLYVPLPILAQLAQELDVAPGVAAGAAGAFGLAYAAGFLVFGPLSDRLGRRQVMVWGLGALALLSASVAWSHAAPLLMAGRALQGFAAAAFPPVVIAYLAERGSARQRSWAVAGLSTAFLSAGLLGQIYGGAVAGRWGLGVAMLPLALVYAATAGALALTPADPRPAARPDRWLAVYRPLGALLADTRLRRVYAPALLLLMCFVAFYLALDAQAGSALQALGITPLAARAVALPGFLMPLAAAVLMPKLGARRLVALGLGLASAGMAACAAAGPEHPLELLAASVLFAAGLGFSVPSLIARVAGLADAPARGLAVALYTFVLFVGASVGPWLAQATAHWPLATTLWLLAALLGAATVYAVSGRDVRAVSAVSGKCPPSA